MDLKFYSIFVCFFIGCCLVTATRARDENQKLSNLSKLFIRPMGRNLTNFETNDKILILIPSGVNFTDLQTKDANNFNLFKLDTDIIFNKDHHGSNHDTDNLTTTDHSENDARRERLLPRLNGEREFRKINLLSGIWNKPKMSPLYLVNGTVCRFVNSTPICTTLSTTGLLPQSNNTSTTNRQSVPVQSGGGSTNQNSGPSQQLRPAGISAEDLQDINVESSINTTEGSMVLRGQQSVRPMITSPANQGPRPLNFVVNRRPLNLFSLRRPVRLFHTVSSRTSELGANNLYHLQGDIIDRQSNRRI